jgi:excinuclease UvrABC ATPase subunit
LFSALSGSNVLRNSSRHHIDLGPGPGHDGGRIVFEGTPVELVEARSTLTGQHLAAYVGSPAEAVASR